MFINWINSEINLDDFTRSNLQIKITLSLDRTTNKKAYGLIMVCYAMILIEVWRWDKREG
jgi:hypothetical protein